MQGVDSEDVKELLNYTKAFDFVADYVFSQGTITESLIREIHRRLVEGVRGNTAQPNNTGSFKITLPTRKPKKLSTPRPRPYDVPVLMAELTDYLQNEQSLEMMHFVLNLIYVIYELIVVVLFYPANLVLTKAYTTG